jgi:hypothetical protein
VGEKDIFEELKASVPSYGYRYRMLRKERREEEKENKTRRRGVFYRHSGLSLITNTYPPKCVPK